MNDRVAQSLSGDDAQARLRDELARADAVAETVTPVLRHLVAAQDNSVFSDEILARVRGMMAGLAADLVSATQPDGDMQGDIETLMQALIDHRDLLAHLHALALEWQLAERLRARLALDPVLSPLLQTLVASGDPDMRGLAQAYLAAQARWVAAQRRMKLPLRELPGDLRHEALQAMQACPALAKRAAHVQAGLDSSWDDGASRLGLAARLVSSLPADGHLALSVTHAGVSLFLSALAWRSGQGRDTVVLSTHEGQSTRLALALRSAGLPVPKIEEQIVALHPGAAMPSGVEQLACDDAACILASTRIAEHGGA